MFDCVWSPFAALDCAVGSGGRVVVRMQMWMSDAKSVILSYRDVCTCVCVGLQIWCFNCSCLLLVVEVSGSGAKPR